MNLAETLELLELVEQAYVLANGGQPKLPPGFELAVPFSIPKGKTPALLLEDPLSCWGFTTRKAGRLYVAFRGTETAGEWAEDCFSLPLVPCGAGSVHYGFHQVWEALRPAVEAAAVAWHTDTVITGHSLGAAIATLCWAELRGELVTFASPRVGDPDFAGALWHGNTTRIINRPDVVPCVPSDPPFRHGGREVMVDGPGDLIHPHVSHALESYRIGLLKGFPA